MPNHVINEIVFRDVSETEQQRLLAMCCNTESKVDFEVLLPVPKNVWQFNVGKIHERLGDNALDWCRKNWGTKWNAYGQDETVPIVIGAGMLSLRFQTAWSPPYPWLVALFNTSKRDFDHNWLDEGAERGHSAEWRWPPEGKAGEWPFEPWKEHLCDEAMQKHLNVLLWGVENLDDIK